MSDFRTNLRDICGVFEGWTQWEYSDDCSIAEFNLDLSADCGCVGLAILGSGGEEKDTVDCCRDGGPYL